MSTDHQKDPYSIDRMIESVWFPAVMAVLGLAVVGQLYFFAPEEPRGYVTMLTLFFGGVAVSRAVKKWRK